MSTPKTVPAFVVVANAADGTPHELGLFFRATDADTFMASLSGMRNVRIEARALPLSDVHEAHQSLFPKEFPQAAPSKK